MYLSAEVLVTSCVICCGVKTDSAPLRVLSVAFAENWCMNTGVKHSGTQLTKIKADSVVHVKLYSFILDTSGGFQIRNEFQFIPH